MKVLQSLSTMLAATRIRLSAVASRLSNSSSLRPLSTSPPHQNQGPGTGENFIQANDPHPRKETPNVSQTNETAVTTAGAQDAPLQESATEGEIKRQLQAPNRAEIWSRSQMPRERAMSGPRFEQTIMEWQVSWDLSNSSTTSLRYELQNNIN